MSKVIGIDLGTTNSVVTAIEGGKPQVIPNSDGQRTTPSIVAYTKDGEVLVIEVAKRQALLNIENTFSSVKRFIGQKTDALVVKREANRVGYKVNLDGPTVKLECPALQKQIAIEEVSAQVLRKLAEDASFI